MLRVGVALACVITVLSGAQVAAGWPGVHPRPLFGTPGKAAYCYVGQTSQEDASASLLCWTPNDGWSAQISWNERRAFTSYYNRPASIVHGIGDLRGYTPRTRIIGFGQRWVYRCADPWKMSTCHVGGAGVTAFTCVSRTTGLTCTNGAGHGWWIGRFRGYRLF
jgi:hypothetical protein